MRYGLPYKGSKNNIAEWVVGNLPPATNFYDLFAGGCAVTHAALLSGKYKTYFANDITDSVTLFTDAIAGKYRDETRWISREDFFRLKDTDPYVRICWSFGNDQKSYLYSKKNEAWKKAVHYAVVQNDWQQFEMLCPQVAMGCREMAKHTTTIKERYSVVKAGIKEFLLANANEEEVFRNPLYNSCEVRTINKTRALGAIDTSRLLQSSQSLKRLQSLESLERLQSLESLERLQSLESDYRDVQILPGSVIYCDPPYCGTTGFVNGFNHDAFYEWCGKQEEIVVISEYEMPETFVCIAEREKCVHYSATNNAQRKMERLFIPKHLLGAYKQKMKEQ